MVVGGLVINHELISDMLKKLLILFEISIESVTTVFSASVSTVESLQLS